MYEEKFLTLPGGFKLPVALITETYTYTELQSAAYQNNDFVWLEEACNSYLKSLMVAGEILHRKSFGEFGDKIYTLKGKYACKEMLGQIRYEEIIKGHGT